MAKLRVDKIASVGVSTETTGSVFFDGTGDYLQISDSTDFTMGSGDYTIEGWFYPGDVSSRRFYGQRASDASELQFLLETNSSSVLIYYFSIGDTNYSVTGNALVANTWYHIAVTRSGNVHTLYVDGTSVATRTQSGSLDDRAQPFSIGRQGNYTAETFSGYISNFRICKGHAVYKSNFAVPTRELDVHPGPEHDRTVLLCCYDGENIFADKSGRHIIAAYGDRSSTPTPASTDSPIGITTLSPGLDRDVDNTFGPSFQGGAGYNSQNWLTLPKGTTTERFPDFGAVDAASARAIFGNGNTPSNTNSMEYITISTTGNASDFGDTADARDAAAALASSTRGLISGGYLSPSTTNSIQYVTISSTGNSSQFGDLSSIRNAHAGSANSTRGLWSGGSPVQNTIEYVTISTDGNTQDFGDLSQSRYYLTACASTERGIFAGGYTPTPTATTFNIIDYVSIPTTGNAVDFGNLTRSSFNLGGLASLTRGVFGGGTPGNSNVIDFITIATLGDAQDFGDLSVNRRTTGAASSLIRGVWAGGAPGTNTIDYVTIASTGDAQDFGDLITARSTNWGLSNGHGGLG